MNGSWTTHAWLMSGSLLKFSVLLLALYSMSELYHNLLCLRYQNPLYMYVLTRYVPKHIKTNNNSISVSNISTVINTLILILILILLRICCHAQTACIFFECHDFCKSPFITFFVPLFILEESWFHSISTEL